MTDKFEDNLNAAMKTSKRIIDEHNVAEQKRQGEERLKKEQAKWESGVVAESVKQFEEFLKKGYKPTYESCGGAKLSSKNGVNILKLACQYGLESEEATKLFVQSKDPEIMEILVKEGKADVCKYSMKKIQEWYDTPDTVTQDPDTIEKRPVKKQVKKERPVYRRVPNPDYWDKGLTRIRHNDGRGWDEVEPFIEVSNGSETYYDYETVYEDVRHEGKKHVIKNNEGAIPAFTKLVELGYKPETPEDAKAFEYMAEKLQKIIEREKIRAKEEAERKAREAKEAAERKAEEKRRDSEIEKIGDCPLGQKLLASALIKAGVMKGHSQIDSLYDVLTTDSQRKEFKRLQQEGIMSEKFEILKPYEFSVSRFFTGSMYDDMRPYTSTSDIKNIHSVKKFINEAEKQHEAEIKAAKEKEEAERKAKEAQKEAERKAAREREKALDTAEKSMLQKIYDDTKLQDIVVDIKQMDQETVNYLTAKMARTFSNEEYKVKNIDKDNNQDNHRVKLLAVCLALYDNSTGKDKAALSIQLLKYRTDIYNASDNRKMFDKARKMLKGEIVEDITVKGLTRKSYTSHSSLNKAAEESGNSDIKRRLRSMNSEFKEEIIVGGIVASGALAMAGVTLGSYVLDKHSHQQDPEEGKNKKEVVLPPDNKNVIEVEGNIDDAKAVELVNDYKKQHAAEKGKDNKGKTYYIVVKNSKKQER